MSGLQIHSLVGRDLGNSVEIVELIGEGGMGVAYRARQHLIQRDLCIKFMQTQHIADKTWLKRFHREVTALSNLSHPHIVNVYFAGLLDGVYPYMAMEYVEGCSLKQRISSAPESRLDLRIGCRIFLQICETLDFIHNSGIVHRDLKPENILLTGEDNLFVKVLDFGICALRESIPGATLTETDLVLGAVHYMAPESFQQSQRAASVDSKGQSVEQARVQTQVQMDENGFKAKEAISLLTLKGIDQKTLTLDKPFMFWIMKDDVSYPLFATTIDKQYWKAPPKQK